MTKDENLTMAIVLEAVRDAVADRLDKNFAHELSLLAKPLTRESTSYSIKKRLEERREQCEACLNVLMYAIKEKLTNVHAEISGEK